MCEGANGKNEIKSENYAGDFSNGSAGRQLR